MSVCLATTWYPRGEFSRFARLLPMLEEVYSSMVIALLPSKDHLTLEQLVPYHNHGAGNLLILTVEDPSQGRFLAVKHALATEAGFIQYIDMDRLLHWVETRPEEWRQMVGEVEKHKCIIFGRSPAAYATHPQALVTTERISNAVVSHLIQREMDVSAGSKCFSRDAAQYLINHGKANDPVNTDAEWPILLNRAGFPLDYLLVDGLDWESADHYQPQAVRGDDQEKAALAYDQDLKNWTHRINIAGQIVQAALEATQVMITQTDSAHSQLNPSDLDAVFEVDDYLYFYSQDLTDERAEMEVNALVTLLKLDEPKVILDLACGFGRHTNRLAMMGHQMTGLDLSSGFLEIARQDAEQRGVEVKYLQGDMRYISFDSEFDCVLLLFTAFGYFSDEENLEVLARIRRALKPGGRLLFDIPNRDAFQKAVPRLHVTERENNLMIDRITFDSLSGRSYNKRIVIRDGVRKDKPFSIRLYNPSEICSLVDQAGLELENIYGGWETQKVTSETGRLVVIACKPE